ncbi:MAG: hypothetical protein KGL67_01215 [Patescibacteria group bacterium]|nr:hypothetical protein [Patescibacteria group bacterium]
MNKNKIGLVLGSFAGLFHLVWGLLIAFGMAQVLLDFIYNLHSLNNPFVVMPFNLLRTLGLVIFTFIMGYIFGYVFAFLWNKFHK